MRKRIYKLCLVILTILLLQNLITILSFEKIKIDKIETIENKSEIKTNGILEIPKINLKKEFYDYYDSRNTVDNNIEVINKNCIPSEPCPFLLASHSGTSYIAYFKNLNKLSLKDTAFLYFQNQKYEYILKEIQYQKKNGTIKIKKDNQRTLILTTCSKWQKDIQEVYIFEPKKESTQLSNQ